MKSHTRSFAFAIALLSATTSGTIEAVEAEKTSAAPVGQGPGASGHVTCGAGAKAAEAGGVRRGEGIGLHRLLFFS